MYVIVYYIDYNASHLLFTLAEKGFYRASANSIFRQKEKSIGDLPILSNVKCNYALTMLVA